VQASGMLHGISWETNSIGAMAMAVPVSSDGDTSTFGAQKEEADFESNGLEFRDAADSHLQQERPPAPSFESSLGVPNSLIMDLPVVMKVVLGSAKMALASVANLTKGSVVRLDKKVGDPADIFVNGRLVARGEVVVIDQDANRFGVVLTQIGGPPPANRKSL